jgi:hypothetical protein
MGQRSVSGIMKKKKTVAAIARRTKNATKMIPKMTTSVMRPSPSHGCPLRSQRRAIGRCTRLT